MLLGLDGGGSKTVCVVSDDDGNLLSRSRSGPSNYHKVGLYAAKTSLKEAVEGALEKGGVDASSVGTACAGLAGAGRAPERSLFAKMLVESLPQSRLLIEDDAYVALVGATEGRPGAIVISGSGSIATAVDRQGRRKRAGGWGHIVGDEGSGYDLARSGLAAALQAQDGRGPETLLSEILRRELYLDSLDELVPYLYDDNLPARRITALFPLVLEAARSGDRVAHQLIENASDHLIRLLEAVVDGLDCGDGFPIAAMGGLWNASPELRQHFESSLERRLPGFRTLSPRHPPEIGALLTARARARKTDLFRIQSADR